MLRVVLPANLCTAPMKAGPFRERGIALVLVIWITTLLLVIAGSFLYAMRTDARAARNAALIARGEALAQAAVSRAAIELFKPVAGPEVWRRDSQARRWAFEGAEVTVRLSDESAKIDINTANNELLKGLFRSAGASEEEAARMVDAVLDWRDVDSLKRPQGAEDTDYSRAGLRGLPANSPFQSTEELQLVLGVSPDIYQRIAPMITIYSRQPGVNPYVASRATLLAIPGLTAEVVDAYLAEREAARREGRPAPAFSAAGPYASYLMTSAVSVVVDVVLDGGIRVSRDAVVLASPQFPRRPYTLLSWREGARVGEADTPTPLSEVPLGKRH